MAKRYRKEYSITNEYGEVVGPPQVFEADTKDELAEMIMAAHQNAAAALYKAKRNAKLGQMLEPDPDQPIQTFEERLLTADDRVRLAKELNDPAKQNDAFTTLLEAKFGAPTETIRQTLRTTEIEARKQFVREQVEVFKSEHPDYVESEGNRNALVKLLNKKGWPITAKNLAIAYNELAEDGLLVLRAKTPEVVETPPAIEASTVVESTTNQSAEITQTTEAVTQNSGETAVVQGPASSGMRRSDSSVGTTTQTTQVQGVTLREINAMNSEQYAKRLASDPEFAKQVEKLYADLKK